MKKRIMPFVALIFALVFGLVLSSCEEEVECGWLTIKNLPSVPSENYWGKNAYWQGGVYYDDDITSYNYLRRFATDDQNCIASFENPDHSVYTGTSPFPLMERGLSKGFLRTGTYLVYMTPVTNGYVQYRVYMSVNFKNGSATIDFNDMMRENDLP